MNKVVFGYNGISNKSVGGGVSKLEDFTIVGCLDVYELAGTKAIGEETQSIDNKELVDKWVFGDIKSIDVVIRQLNKLKEMMIKEKMIMNNGDACYIFRNIKAVGEDENYRTVDIINAVEQVANMETHNSITKDEMLEVIKWLVDYIKA